MKRILLKLISYLDHLFPKKTKQLLYYTFADLTDNGFAFFVYMANNHLEYKNIWIVDDISKKEQYRSMIASYSNTKNYIFVEKGTMLALYYYLTTKFVFITHNLYKGANISSNHHIVNLWHGMPIKNIGILDNKDISILQKQKYITVTSNYYKSILHRAFGTRKEDILVTGQARNDLLFERNNSLQKIGFDRQSYNKIIIWLPTYRKSNVGEIRNDGTCSNSLPVVNGDRLLSLSSFFKSENILCLVKLHPMDSLNTNELNGLSNIFVIDNAFLEQNGIQLNSLMSECDILMTDYSSVFIDYMLLKKPIILLADDISEYENSRGFIESDIRSFMPVEFTETYTDLIAVLNNILNNDYQCKYHNEKLFNDVTQNFSENIYLNVIKPYE